MMNHQTLSILKFFYGSSDVPFHQSNQQNCQDDHSLLCCRRDVKTKRFLALQLRNCYRDLQIRSPRRSLQIVVLLSFAQQFRFLLGLMVPHGTTWFQSKKTAGDRLGVNLTEAGISVLFWKLLFCFVFFAFSRQLCKEIKGHLKMII